MFKTLKNNKHKYELTQDDINFFHYLYKLDNDNKLIALSNIKNLIFFETKTDLYLLNLELKVFIKEIYEKQIDCYQTIIDLSNFKIMNKILAYKEWTFSYMHPQELDILKEQINTLNFLLKEIKQHYPIQTKEYNLEQLISDYFFDFKKYEQLQSKFYFIEYVSLSKYIEENQVIIDKLKKLRFHGFPELKPMFKNNTTIYDYFFPHDL